MDMRKLMIIAFAVTILGLIIAAGAAYKKGYVDFLGRRHIYGLILFLISSITLWAGLNFISHANEGFDFGTKSKVSLIASILIAVLTWIRYSYISAEVDK